MGKIKTRSAPGESSIPFHEWASTIRANEVGSGAIQTEERNEVYAQKLHAEWITDILEVDLDSCDPEIMSQKQRLALSLPGKNKQTNKKS